MIRLSGLVAVSLLVAGAGVPRAPEPADLVLKNGAIYTVDAARRWAQAMAIANGRIVYVAAGDDIGAYV